MERVRHYSINGWMHVANFAEVRLRGGGGGGIEPKNKQRTIYVERVRHYSIDGWMHVVPISLRFGGGVVMRMGTQQ